MSNRLASRWLWIALAFGLPLGAAPAPEDRERLARSPRQVAEQLAAVYGKKLDQVAYIPALPLVAKLRLSEATREPRYAEEVGRIVAPYLRGEKNPVPRSGSEQAGHLIFAELALRSKGKDRERWTLLCRAAADQILDRDGKPLPLMPHHNEMSDAVFMAGPILAATGKLTGERKYFDAAATHFASMRKLCLRRDGLYRHSPLCEAAWGRGNGFPALGLALALSDWPEDHPAKKELIAEFKKHMAALRPHQDAKTGCWHQVIDHPETYDEYSCTCMIAFAMQRGITRGWLPKDEYQPSVERAWAAIKERTSADGKLVNVCTGTGKMKTLRDYFERPAINGRDDRGGAMGLMFTTELMAASGQALNSATPDIGSRRELFVDRQLIDTLMNAELRMHKPAPQEVVFTCDAPWEGNTSAYFTLFADGPKFRMYYRGSHFDETAHKSAHPEYACYAESTDGLRWEKPKLGLFEHGG